MELNRNSQLNQISKIERQELDQKNMELLKESLHKIQTQFSRIHEAADYVQKLDGELNAIGL